MHQALQEEANNNNTRNVKLIFSRAFQHAYEGINANSVNIVKAVGLASTIAVPELISASNNIMTAFGNKSEMMTFLLVFYFFIVYAFIFLLDILRKRIVHTQAHGGKQ